MKASDTFRGKTKTFEEVFRSPFEKDSQEEALQVLQEIREAHPSTSGWVEVTGYIEPLPNGKWRAVRHHAQYK